MTEIRSLSTRVNQQLLLEHTYESRICSRLLDDTDDVWVDGETAAAEKVPSPAAGPAAPEQPGVFAPGQFEVS